MFLRCLVVRDYLIERAHGMKILSLNACVLPPCFTSVACCSNDNKDRRLQLAAEFCDDRNADVVVLQEVWDSAWSSKNVRNAFTAFAAFAHVSHFSPLRWHFTNTGTMVLSKYPIIEHHQVIFRATAGFQSLVSNGAHHAKLVVPDVGELHIIVTHIHAGPNDSAWRNNATVCRQVQMSQLCELKEFIHQVVPSNGRCVLVGDFNSDAIGQASSSRDLLPFSEVVAMFGESALQSIDFPSTYPFPTSGGKLVNAKFAGESTCVDHIFTPLDVRSVAVHEPRQENTWFSDHAIVEVEI